MAPVPKFPLDYGREVATAFSEGYFPGRPRLEVLVARAIQDALEEAAVLTARAATVAAAAAVIRVMAKDTRVPAA